MFLLPLEVIRSFSMMKPLTEAGEKETDKKLSLSYIFASGFIMMYSQQLACTLSLITWLLSVSDRFERFSRSVTKKCGQIEFPRGEVRGRILFLGHLRHSVFLQGPSQSIAQLLRIVPL